MAERAALTEGYLGQYAKALSRPQLTRIATASQAANPLYLRAMLEELRLFGEFGRLEARLGELLSAPDIQKLYELILIRWEEDYERNRPGLVGDAMRALWAARRGLSETELLSLLGTGGDPLPHAYWSPLHLAAKQTLIDRDGLLGFAHRRAREAVGERYLPDPATKAAVHRRLASFFERPAPDIIGPKSIGLGLPRDLEERPWQLVVHPSSSLYRVGSLLVASKSSPTSSARMEVGDGCHQADRGVSRGPAGVGADRARGQF